MLEFACPPSSVPELQRLSRGIRTALVLVLVVVVVVVSHSEKFGRVAVVSYGDHLL
jgi:hypothetical protein